MTCPASTGTATLDRTTLLDRATGTTWLRAGLLLTALCVSTVALPAQEGPAQEGPAQEGPAREPAQEGPAREPAQERPAREGQPSGVPGVWFLNTLGTGAADDWVRLSVGGTPEEPPTRLDQVEIGWVWDPGSNGDGPERFPDTSARGRFVAGSNDTNRYRNQPLDAASRGFPVLGLGPGNELWLLANIGGGRDPEATGWAEVLDAIEAAWRHSMPGISDPLGVQTIGELGSCRVRSAAVPGSDQPDGWAPHQLAGRARASLQGGAFYTEANTTETGTSKAVEVHRFLRWVEPGSPDAAPDCGPDDGAPSSLRLFPIPPGPIPETSESFLVLRGTSVRRLDFYQLDPDTWEAGLRTIIDPSLDTLSAAGTAGSLTAQPRLTAEQQAALLEGETVDLCANAADVTRAACDRDLRFRRQLYRPDPAASSVWTATRRQRLLDACETALADLPGASCDTDDWHVSQGGAFLSHFGGVVTLGDAWSGQPAVPQLLSTWLKDGPLNWRLSHAGDTASLATLDDLPLTLLDRYDLRLDLSDLLNEPAPSTTPRTPGQGPQSIATGDFDWLRLLQTPALYGVPLVPAGLLLVLLLLGLLWLSRNRRHQREAAGTSSTNPVDDSAPEVRGTSAEGTSAEGTSPEESKSADEPTALRREIEQQRQSLEQLAQTPEAQEPVASEPATSEPATSEPATSERAEDRFPELLGELRQALEQDRKSLRQESLDLLQTLQSDLESSQRQAGEAWQEQALETVLAQVNAAVQTRVDDRLQALAPLLEAPETLQQVVRLHSALAADPQLAQRLLALAERLPSESWLGLLEPTDPRLAERSRGQVDQSMRAAEEQLATELAQLPEKQRQRLATGLRAGSQLSAWSHQFWAALRPLAGGDRLLDLADRLPAPAAAEWRRAYGDLRAFAAADAAVLRRLGALADGRPPGSLGTTSAIELERLEQSGLLPSSNAQASPNTVKDLPRRLRDYLEPYDQGGPFSRITLALQYLLEAWPIEQLEAGDRSDLRGSINQRLADAGLADDVHGLLVPLAAAIGLRYRPVRYYKSRVDQDEMKFLRREVTAIPLSERVGFAATTDPQVVVRLRRPFLFDLDTNVYYAGHAHVARNEG